MQAVQSFDDYKGVDCIDRGLVEGKLALRNALCQETVNLSAQDLTKLGFVNVPFNPSVAHVLHDIMNGYKYRTGLIQERLDAGCTPYAVHGDGVQVMKRTQFGKSIRVYH